MNNKDKVIVALDYANEQDARTLIDKLDDSISYYKVGLELFLNSRGSILDYLKKKDKHIFLDLKFHDIPNTTAQACAWAATLGVDMFNVHASGGAEMMRTCMDKVQEVCAKTNAPAPTLIGVTILTSFNEEGIAQVGYKNNIADTALNLAKLAQSSGLNGVVCSSHEVSVIKEACGKEFMTVCPGIRPAWAVVGDQKRIVTPADAIRMGVDYMVVGRPITKAENPMEAAMKVVEEVNSVEL